MNFRFSELAEDMLINRGLLVISFTIIISSIFSGSTSPILCMASFVCAIGFLPLAVNSFVIEYRKRFSIDTKHDGRHFANFIGLSSSFIGFLIALYSINLWLPVVLIMGLAVTLFYFPYLDKLVEVNKKKAGRTRWAGIKNASTVGCGELATSSIEKHAPLVTTSQISQISQARPRL